ncbi:MAG: TIGR03809 family protein [Bradyrhizobium sp.]
MDVAHDRDIVARWCNLAEQRLEYLTELFETGRWRRYHSELAFLENIQEAKTAVETWRGLSMREASFDNSAIDMSWLGRSKAPQPRRETVRDQAASPQPVKILDEPLPSSVPALVASDLVGADDAPSVAVMEHIPEPTLDIAAIEQRYPLLRNAL